MNDLRRLMDRATDHPPRESDDLGSLLGIGRRRVRMRRTGIVGCAALAAGAVTVASLTWSTPSAPDPAAAGIPGADGPVIDLADARAAVEGTDVRELASYTNEDLDADNGQYFDGVTDDGLILFRDGPRSDQLFPRYALMDPATGEKDWLPDLGIGQDQVRALQLSDERLVLAALGTPTAHVFDRGTRTWSTVSWPGLSRGAEVVDVGPDGRLFVLVPATQGSPPPGGWPTSADGDAEDAGAEGDTYDLWSASPTDSTDVRDEGLRVGSFGFADDSLVWTDSSNGAAGRVHVRDLATGEETSFDPRLGERCNLLGLSVAGEHLAMSQYCGTDDDGVRDDRVQVVTTAGEPVVTIQDDGVGGGQLDEDGHSLVLTASNRVFGGTYVYDLEYGSLLRLSDASSSFNAASGPAPGGAFLWNSPAGRADPQFAYSGVEAHLSELVR